MSKEEQIADKLEEICKLYQDISELENESDESEENEVCGIKEFEDKIISSYLKFKEYMIEDKAFELTVHLYFD